MKTLTAISALLALAASLALLVFPAYTGETTEHTRTSATLVEVNGRGAAAALAFPLLVAAMPILFPRRWVRIAAAILLAAFAIVSGFSIGLFYLPSAAVMAAAALKPVPQ